ncbi:putative nucleotidyltransferase substrate binding domain-containing protein [Thiomicrorhabdus sp. zzn3]|uniref:putative nucleotidyltransferase substrate binding domain-containing protein n=1 Tax=Thiomicrorhabdus sp. zzn3 TaxID=3039775 RepID=UPI0024372A66|nr:putative nucleotidyltransferase substrate binding domain-containing protein [Thiomicrorhabdus sp. zzn3]MDG6777884.1 putative nucleotidyltransferase substrate binding domain-containing protein [Thiomicrorhabdus sp. zzn3]
MAIQQQAEFLQHILPFNELTDAERNYLAEQMDVVYFPVGSVMTPNRQESHDLYFIIKGRVAEYQQEQLVANYGVRGFFGEKALLSESSENEGLYFKVVEEAILYRLSGDIFIPFLNEHAAFRHHFEAGIVEKLNAWHRSQQVAASTEVMMDTVCSAPIRPLVEVSEAATLQEVAQALVSNEADACVVKLETPQAQTVEYGLLTSTDLVKIMAQPEMHARFPVKEYVSQPLITVHEFDYLFNALLKLTRYQIDRLVVRSDHGLKGFLTQKDLMGLFANQSGLALLQIEQACSQSELQQVAEHVDELVKNLHHKGIKTHYIAKLVNELHRKLINKLFELVMPEALLDRVALLVMGSEGRSEQVLRTDQDNAILYDHLQPAEIGQLQHAAERFSRAMLAIGFPACPGNIMVSNPMWRASLRDFKNQLKAWFDRPSADSFMNLAIFYDAHTVYGQEGYLQQMRQLLFSRLDDNEMFLRHFAKAALQFETPIGFLGGFISEQQGGSDKIDLKKGGIFPIVHGVRCYALEARLQQTNTHWRIKALMDLNVFDEEFGIELGETLNFFNTLRLQSMLEQKAQGRGEGQLDNKVALQSLSHLQQDLLKQAFAVVDRFKKRLQRHFKLHEVG